MLPKESMSKKAFKSKSYLENPPSLKTPPQIMLLLLKQKTPTKLIQIPVYIMLVKK